MGGSLKMDGGREVELDSKKHPHLDHGYAVTSHSSQGQTADRVLIHVDTELGAKDLLNNRMAYVAVSRGAYDAQLFTNDREKLGRRLSNSRIRQRSVRSVYKAQEHLSHGLRNRPCLGRISRRHNGPMPQHMRGIGSRI
jgi:ATP-dependent exoDNAse (exonuclease V) alpha subunit